MIGVFWDKLVLFLVPLKCSWVFSFAEKELEGRLKEFQGRTCYFYPIASLLVVLIPVNAMADPENMISF